MNLRKRHRPEETELSELWCGWLDGTQEQKKDVSVKAKWLLSGIMGHARNPELRKQRLRIVKGEAARATRGVPASNKAKQMMWKR